MVFGIESSLQLFEACLLFNAIFLIRFSTSNQKHSSLKLAESGDPPDFNKFLGELENRFR